MTLRKSLATLAASLFLVTLSGCAVMRDQSTMGQFVDDTTITTQIKARIAKHSTLSSLAVGVETLNGVVQLSGFVKTDAERDAAHKIAHGVSGVKDVKNYLAVAR